MVEGESKHDEGAPDAPPSISPARVVKAMGYSVDGLAGAWRTEGAFRQEVIFAVVLIPLSCFIPVSMLEHGLLVASVLLVLAVELLNSSLEAAIDRISMERNPLSKKAKDAGSAAVLMTILLATVLWGAILARFVIPE